MTPLSNKQMQDLMSEALELSKRALPDCSPNPPVGCIIVKDGNVIARGYTQEPGQAHAEAQALSLAGANAKGATVVVTLEPCSFYGRTPSCAQALIDAEVKSVIVGTIDTDPRNNGKGLQMLRDAGIEVQCSVLSEEVENFLRPYLITQTN